VFVGEGFAASAPVEADIEDLIDPAIYEALVRETYEKEVAGWKKPVSQSFDSSYRQTVRICIP
jgi:hypothetical protein